MIIALYKEKGKTSRFKLNELKKNIKEKKLGHAGTLDPLARGVLVVGIGRESTKQLHSERFNEKEYIAKIILGKYSTTDDEEGEKTLVNKKGKIPELKEVKEVLGGFIGEVEQVPPLFSAIKIKGKESYKWARKGKKINLNKRKAWIKEIKLLKYKYPFLKIKVVTGRGVYIRSLARDIGKKLLVGGYLGSLLRTKVGEFTLKDCKKI